jgi:hypothetical protein
MLATGTYYAHAIGFDKSGNPKTAVTNTFTIGSVTRSVITPDAPASSVQVSTASATASIASVNLVFTGAVDAASATDTSHYTATVNGTLVEIESAALVNNSSVVLGLPELTLNVADKVVVSYSIRDGKGLQLVGEQTITAR